MNTANSQNAETTLVTLLSKNSKLEVILNSLSLQFPQNKLSLCDFLHFCITNDVFLDQTIVSLLLIYLKCSHEISAFNYIIEMTNIILTFNKPVFTFAIHSFLIDPKMTNLLVLEVESISAFLEKKYSTQNQMNIESLISNEIAKLPNIGPSIPFNGIFCFKDDDSSKRIFENYEEAAEILTTVKNMTNSSNSNIQMDFLLPIPEEIPIGIEDFLTPFPFILEAPMINPNLPYPSILNDMVKNCSKLSENEIKAF